MFPLFIKIWCISKQNIVEYTTFHFSETPNQNSNHVLPHRDIKRSSNDQNEKKPPMYKKMWIPRSIFCLLFSLLLPSCVTTYYYYLWRGFNSVKTSSWRTVVKISIGHIIQWKSQWVFISFSLTCIGKKWQRRPNGCINTLRSKR